MSAPSPTVKHQSDENSSLHTHACWASLPTVSKKKGFGAMDPARQREIASAGGKAAHAAGRAHEFTSDEAADAGRRGGEAVSKDREHMSRIGRKGGLAKGKAKE
jgi:uncharacterized protein